MNETTVVIDAGQELATLRTICATFSDQTEDHLSAICSILISYSGNLNVADSNTMYNRIVDYVNDLGEPVPAGLLETCMVLFSKIYVTCHQNLGLNNIKAISMAAVRPYLAVIVYST